MKMTLVTSLIMGTAMSATNVSVQSLKNYANQLQSEATAEQAISLTDLPQIPFSVEYAAYNKTIDVVSGCGKRAEAVTLKFKSTDANIAKTVYTAVDRAFDKPGITMVQVCRTARVDTKHKL